MSSDSGFPTSVNVPPGAVPPGANPAVLGDAPAVAMGNFMTATAQAMSNAAHNATNAQQNAWVTAEAAATQGVATLYALDTAATAEGSAVIYR